MEYFGYAYFVERPRRIEDLMVLHLIERRSIMRISSPTCWPTVSLSRITAAAVKRAKSGTVCSSAAEVSPMASLSCRRKAALSAVRRLLSSNML